MNRSILLTIIIVLLTACTMNPPSIRPAPIEPMPWDMTAAAQRNPEGRVDISDAPSRIITSENINQVVPFRTVTIEEDLTDEKYSGYSIFVDAGEEGEVYNPRREI